MTSSVVQERPWGRLTDHVGLGVVSARFDRDLLEEVLNRTVALAGWAAIIALDTLRDQQQINRSQLAVNQLAQERAKQRYAARVAFWGDGDKDGTIHIQNRSPVPLVEVGFGSYPGLPTFWIDDVPPCVIATVKIKFGFREHATTEAIGTLDHAIHFTGPNGSWVRSGAGLAAEDRNIAQAIAGTAVSLVTPVEDCGEGG